MLAGKNNKKSGKPKPRKTQAKKSTALKKAPQKAKPRLTRQMVNKGLASAMSQVDTMDGLKWALATLHPCSETMTEAVGYPDDNNLPTHCTRMQRTITISPPGVKCTTTGSPSVDLCSWNLCIVTTPWPEYPWLVCPTQGTDEPPTLADYIKNHFIKNGDKKGETLEWNVWSLYAFPNFMSPDRWSTGLTVDANNLRQKYQKVRVVGKGTTTYLNASRLYDGGRVICGQYPVASRYLDTFNTDSVSIDTEDLVDKILARLCVVGKGSFNPEEVRKITEHVHSVQRIQPEATTKTVVTGSATTELTKTEVTVSLPTPQANVDYQKPVVDVSLQSTGLITDSSLQHTHSNPNITIKPSDFATFGTHTHDIPGEDLSHAHDVEVDVPVYARSQMSTGLPLDALRSVLQHKHNVDVEGTIYQSDTDFPYQGKPEYTLTINNSQFNEWSPRTEGKVRTEDSSSGDVTVRQMALTGGPATIPVGRTGSGDMRGIPIVVNGQSKATVTQQQPTVKIVQGNPQVSVVQPKATTTVESNAVSTTIVSPVQVDTGAARWTTPIPEFADECLEIKKKGEKLGNIKLIKDPKVTDHPDWFISEPPVTENLLFYGDSKATTWEARHGTYQVVRINNWDLDDLHTGSATFYDLADWDEANVQPTDYAKTFNITNKGCGTWAVAYYRNINTATSVTLKCVQFTEGVVNPVGPFANLTPSNMDPDPAAIALVTEESRRLAHAYPSKFNDLGALLGTIFNVAKQIGSAVKSVSSGLSNIPGIGGVAKGISDLLGGLGL